VGIDTGLFKQGEATWQVNSVIAVLLFPKVALRAMGYVPTWDVVDTSNI